MGDTNSRDMVADTNAVLVPADADPKALVPLMHYDRHVAVYMNQLHVLWAGSVVDWNGGKAIFIATASG